MAARRALTVISARLTFQGESEKLPRKMVDRKTIESVDDRLVSLMRLILALSALTLIYIDPSQPDRLVNITYGALILYSIYSAAIYFLTVKHHSLLRRVPLHWIDVCCYLVLISLNGTTNSVFFFLFFFVILVASFRSGYEAGLRVTFVSASLFAVIGYLTAPTGVEPNRLLMRAIYLIAIGYLMAYWGGSEITHKRRLALLKDVNRLSNPRFGVDHTVGSIMTRLRAFYDADACLLITASSDSGQCFLRRADRHHREHASRAEMLDEETAKLLLHGLPSDLAVLYHKGSSRWWFNSSSCTSYNLISGERAKDSEAACAAVADLLETDSFISIPLPETLAGRLYLKSKTRRFSYSDLDFLRHLIEHVMPMIDNIRLVDRLASEASEHERQRISRDIHDSAIQPYIGLKLGLDAIRRKVAPGDPLSGDIEELADKTGDVIKELRQYVGGLKEHDSDNQGNMLASSLERQARKFGEFYGIQVAVEVAPELNMNDRMAAEVFQIVREGLSNIRRHTSSRRARISMASVNGELTLNIENDNNMENDNSNAEPRGSFTPRSITERATALGGRVTVNVSDDERTVVSVAIPL